jgi:glycosyltransferase involved in cell wall biosynthesis
MDMKKYIERSYMYKIGIIGTHTDAIKKVTFGGTESITYQYVESLVSRGYDVTLYGSKESRTHAKQVDVVSIYDIKLESFIDQVPQKISYQSLVINAILNHAKHYDIVHSFIYDFQLLIPFFSLVETPIVCTLSNPIYIDPIWRIYLEKFTLKKTDRIIFPSEFMYSASGKIPLGRVIPLGIDITDFSFQEKSTSSFLWLSRPVPEKGLAHAIEASVQSNSQLIVNSVPFTKKHHIYIDTVVHSAVSKYPNIHYTEKQNIKDKVGLYQQAKALLFPILWDEPFGLVMIEAMACGTPVIAYNRGAVSEIIKDGETGFIVEPDVDKNPNDKFQMTNQVQISNDTSSRTKGNWIIKKRGVEGLVEAIKLINTMSKDEYIQMRRNCRKHVEEHFTVERMVDSYEKVYKQIIEHAK